MRKTQEQLLQEDKEKYTREDIYRYYVEENHSKQELYAHYPISEQRILNLLKEYNIVKGHKAGYQKARQTLKERYGSETYNNRDKYKETCRTVYGCDNPFQSEDIKIKSKQSCVKRYGVEYPMQNEEIQKISVSNHDYEKMMISYRKTMQDKYGVDYASQLKSSAQKARQTSEDRYGGIGFSSPILNEKIKRTTEERYGVPYYCMTDECRSASSNNSVPNNEFAELLKENDIEFEREFKLGSYSYDFRVGDILIEIDPTATHNSTWHPFKGKGIDRNYHKSKTEYAKENNFRCIHIFDWDDKKKIISILKMRKKIYARDCKVKRVEKSERENFINKYHLQGYARDEFGYGLYYGEELVSVMTFGKPRYNLNFDYELIRYCSSYYVVGGAEKIFSHFLKDFPLKSVISYCDESKFSGDVYSKLGFRYDGKKISCHWYNMKTGKHILDSLLRQRGADQMIGTREGKGTDNSAIMESNGFVRVYDAGQSRYIMGK